MLEVLTSPEGLAIVAAVLLALSELLSLTNLVEPNGIVDSILKGLAKVLGGDKK